MLQAQMPPQRDDMSRDWCFIQGMSRRCKCIGMKGNSMTTLTRALLRLLAFGLPVAAGVLAVLFSGAFKAASEANASKQQQPSVRVIQVVSTAFRPRASGYGAVLPAREWRAVARIEGVIAETSPLLAAGQIVPEGTQLARIDETEILLSLAQTDAQLKALDVRDETLGASLAISRADLEISRTDLKRQDELLQQGTIAQTARDQVARQELSARAKMTEVENQLALNAAERAVLQAQRAIAAHSLEFTHVIAPFDLRISEVQADLGQFVTRGSPLFTADGTDAAEVEAQFAMGELGPLVRALPPGGTVLDLVATVRLSQAGHDVEWPAKVVRAAEAIDSRTQASGIVVRIEQPQGQAVPGARPPLRRGMFVEVELSAPARPALVVPDRAVQGGRGLVVNAEGKLEPRDLRVDFSMDGIAVIGAGLTEGEMLVVTDPAVAVPGMVVRSVEDKPLQAEITRIALGEDNPK